MFIAFSGLNHPTFDFESLGRLCYSLVTNSRVDRSV